MKAQKNLEKNVTRKHLSKKEILGFVLTVVAMVEAFFIGYIFTYTIYQKPMTEGQFELCEQVAKDVYEHKKDESYNVPDIVSVDVEGRTVFVTMKDHTYRDKVIARKENGELIISRYLQTEEARCKSLLIGFLFAILTGIIMELFDFLEEDNEEVV